MQTRPSSRRRNARRAFTIVELLVVIGIIGLLMGLIIGGLRGALGTARKTKELNGLRGIHAAWYQYSTTFEEQLLPGFVDTATQAAWEVTSRNTSGKELARGFSQTYPWRLSAFVDNPFSTFVGYIEISAGGDSADNAVSEPWDGSPAPMPWMDGVTGNPGSLMSLQPAFAYNAYYVGGWYEGGAPAPRFANAQWTTGSGGASRGGLVATRLAGISRTTEVVIFASGTYRGVGDYPISGNREDLLPGSSWIVPPLLGQTAVWEPSMGTQRSVNPFEVSPPDRMRASPQSGGMPDTGVLGVRVAQGVPVRRHNGLVATVHADGSTASTTAGSLMDMRAWIDIADAADFQHQDN